MYNWILIALSCLLLFGCEYGETGRIIDSEDTEFHIATVAEDLGVVWGMAFLNDAELIVTEREGSIKKIVLETNGASVHEITGGPNDVRAERQGGMLDVAVAEGFKKGDWIYFTYSKKTADGAATTLSRAILESSTLIDWQDLLVTKAKEADIRHFGSRIAFDQSGHLFFSVGDRGVRRNSQDTSNHAGTILRLNLDGTVPDDNPFINGGGLPEIWSYGHRNPQGLFWDKQSKKLLSIEHGPRGGDEINIIVKGGNYGWPVVSHGREYSTFRMVGEATSKPGMIDPIKVYTPSIAPSSLIRYSGSAFPQWRGNLFAGALALVHLNRIVVDESLQAVKEERLLGDLDERIRAVTESPQGWLYISTDSGRILRLTPANH